jgi:hypothetical protein
MAGEKITGARWIDREGAVGVVGVVEVPPSLSASVDIHQQRVQKLKRRRKEKREN